MNTSRLDYDDIIEYAWENGVDLGFITVTEMKMYQENLRLLLDKIIEIMERDG